MDYPSIIAAALAGFAFRAVWYGALSRLWIAASGVPVGDDGAPKNAKSPMPYLTSFFCILLVSGMMSYGFAISKTETVGKGLVYGLGVGAFFITPWIVLNNGYPMRPWRLSAIDGGYATLGCGAIGTVLALF